MANDKDKSEETKRKAAEDNGYAEHIEHLEGTRPEPWPGIRGRSDDEENELPTGTPRERQAGVTDTQRRLEQEAHGRKEPTRK
ncbi:hypothetical protein [Comamonas sp. JC664]|uniref:hypothetical protein n=1 Tax=Comamonas sp. JC664 TaxID=2801917 RepID=UPI00174A2E57|nr:hypothetical protein [Comamonas sp. JC664]MBL0693687.1 hypothetical protein [Comamonas sp. JC664]GHG73849.1 hypothetical protein GCM10012319_21110 [Comamonas sp. KCTC 72670]